MKISRETVLQMTNDEFHRVRDEGVCVLGCLGNSDHARWVSVYQCAFVAVRFLNGELVVVDDMQGELTDENVAEIAKRAVRELRDA